MKNIFFITCIYIALDYSVNLNAAEINSCISDEISTQDNISQDASALASPYAWSTSSEVPLLKKYICGAKEAAKKDSTKDFTLNIIQAFLHALSELTVPKELCDQEVLNKISYFEPPILIPHFASAVEELVDFLQFHIMLKKMGDEIYKTYEQFTPAQLDGFLYFVNIMSADSCPKYSQIIRGILYTFKAKFSISGI